MTGAIVRLRNVLAAVVSAREAVDGSYYVETVLEGIEVDLVAVIDQLEAEPADSPALLADVFGRLEALADENESLRRELDSALRSLRQLQVESGGGAS